jgi:hypothetical protein
VIHIDEAAFIIPKYIEIRFEHSRYNIPTVFANGKKNFNENKNNKKVYD